MKRYVTYLFDSTNVLVFFLLRLLFQDCQNTGEIIGIECVMFGIHIHNLHILIPVFISVCNMYQKTSFQTAMPCTQEKPVFVNLYDQCVGGALCADSNDGLCLLYGCKNTFL